MSIKAVFLDLDGTSLNEHHELSPKLIKTLQHLKQKNIEVVFCTGRSFTSSKRFSKEIGGCNYIINYNGARIYDFQYQKILQDITLPSSIINKVFSFSQQHHYPPIFYHNDMVFTREGYHHDYADCYEGEVYNTLSADIDWAQEKLTKALFIVPEEKMEFMRHTAIEFFKHADVCTSAETFLEIMPKGVNKGKAVKEVLDILQLSPDQAIAFGDQLNDIEMLQTVKHGFIMGNATTLKTQLPNHQKVAKNSEDGVADTLISLFNLTL